MILTISILHRSETRIHCPLIFLMFRQNFVLVLMSVLFLVHVEEKTTEILRLWLLQNLIRSSMLELFQLVVVSRLTRVMISLSFKQTLLPSLFLITLKSFDTTKPLLDGSEAPLLPGRPLMSWKSIWLAWKWISMLKSIWESFSSPTPLVIL